jgi:DNA (cytosine-5)-methyltransferase 1
MLTVLDLFSGIGGFSLGLERTGGFKTVAFCEIDPYCRKVLAKHWPEVPCYDDIRTLVLPRRFTDVIVGGFPCQDISTAGEGAGIEGERSGLWKEYARLIGEIRPQFIIVENVAALLGRGLNVVLGDLTSLGYDAEWYVISAKDLGAPHLRERVWIIAYPNGNGLETNANQIELRNQEFRVRYAPILYRSNVWDGPHPNRARIFRVDNGVSSDVDRLRALGNAVVPQIPELIGRAILTYEQSR